MRNLHEDEWTIVAGVFTRARLPFRFRIGITDAAGLGGAPFTVPTSLISPQYAPVMALGPPTIGLAMGVNYLLSAANFGYLINVGKSRYDDLVPHAALLVHEMTHVWQGKDALFANRFVYSSLYHQGKGSVFGISRDDAYAYNGRHVFDYPGGLKWSAYNAEQQAQIVEDWFVGIARNDVGEYEPQSQRDWRFRYIRDNIRA